MAAAIVIHHSVLEVHDVSIVPVPDFISTFGDALGVALELSDEFAYVQAVAILDPAHRCIDFRVFDQVDDGLAIVLTWLCARQCNYPHGSRVLLVSVRSINGFVIAERDLADYRFAAHMIAALGAHLLDWIETDGEIVRSFAYIINPNTSWSAQALAEGALDQFE